MNVRKFKVDIEQEVEISIDMDKYNDETITQVGDYWGFDDDKEIFLEELVEFLVCNYLTDGHFNRDLEGIVIDGHFGSINNINVEIEEVENKLTGKEELK